MLARLLPLDRSQRDQSAAMQSFLDFSELVARFPNSQYSKAKIVFLMVISISEFTKKLEPQVLRLVILELSLINGYLTVKSVLGVVLSLFSLILI